MTFLYFGIYQSDFGRNQVYIQALRKAGHTVLECQDHSPGWRKWVRLYQKHRAVRDSYDVLVVGCYGHIAVPFARLVSKKPVIADMVGLMEDIEFYSHTQNRWRRLKNRFVDWVAHKSAHTVLVESEAQKTFCAARFGTDKKLQVVYTGTEEETFFCNARSADQKPFRVLFRGRLTPESGIETVLAAAKLLKDRADIVFRIIGFGYRLKEVQEYISKEALQNVELIAELLPFPKLREKMCESSVSLGQFGDNPRLARAIPHKAFESMRMGLPYVTGPGAIEELLTHDVSCVVVLSQDAPALANALVNLAGNPSRSATLAREARRLYDERVSQQNLAERLMSIAQGLLTPA